MRGVLVAIDLETTGLNAYHDEIIEIGAVKIQDGAIVAEYSTFIDPGRAIPQAITHLTGITTEDVANAPTLRQALPDLLEFVGDATLIGHNVAFDMGFLARWNVLEDHRRVDTYDLASVLLPQAPRYSLSSLAAQFEINLESAHRALDDARVTALLYWVLWEKALSLPISTLSQIVNAARDVNWDTAAVFAEAWRSHPDYQFYGDTAEVVSPIKLFQPELDELDMLVPGDAIGEIPPAAVSAVIDQEGILAQSIDGYEHRPQQLRMADAVIRAFNNGEHLLIEAGTGTGKSIAYLVPSILWTVSNDQRVVISTNTINLQEQLILKDIPMLQESLNIPFKAALMKGRGNYLCPRRLDSLITQRPTSVDEMRLLAKILVWLIESSTGDKGEISLRGPAENNAWQRLSAEDEDCQHTYCMLEMEGRCPFYKARRAADEAHIVIVNHALLIIDAMTENHVLPDYKYLIIDEAHHLEDAITNGLSFRLDEATLKRRLANLGDEKHGLLGVILSSIQGEIPERDYRRYEEHVLSVSQAVTLMEIHVVNFFHACRTFIEELDAKSDGDFAAQVRVVPSMRNLEGFAQVRYMWDILKEFMQVISGSLVKLSGGLIRLDDADIPNYNSIMSRIHAETRYFEQVVQELEAFSLVPDPNKIYWMSVNQYNLQVTIHIAPLHIGLLVQDYLWERKDSVVLTSATLRTADSFDYICDRLNAEDVHTIEVGSPFNYRESTLLYIPSDMPEPTDRQAYQQAVERGIIDLAAALDGRVMVLFTSYSQLRQTSQAISPRLALGNIVVYDQSDGTSRQALLEGFKTTEKAVLLGTGSFWEGVDVPGDSLSGLVIVRLPFSVPSDPIFAARSETYSNSFSEYSVPEAILRFRQGFGRLIRRNTDRGVVAIFDKRVISKGYGATFLQSLPDCKVERGSLKTLPNAAKQWLAKNGTK